MRKTLVRVFVPALLLGAALAVWAGPALAHGGKRGAGGSNVLLQAAATYIGVTQADIKAARKAGQSLAQLATSKGKTVQGLTDALVAAGNASIDKAQADGKITAAKATALKAALPDRVNALINATGAACARSGAGTSLRSHPAGLRRR
jgi:hypothetical protein